MKLNIKLLALAALAGTMLTACASPALLTPQTSQVQTVQTNTVTMTVTNTVTNTVTQTLTNGVTVTNTVVQTNFSSQTYPIFVTNTYTVTNGYQVSAGASNTIATLSALNTATSAANPFSGAISLGLAAIAGGLGLFASIKSKQAASHLSTASTIITAVEGLEPTVAAGVKAAVAAQSAKMGTGKEVAAVVQAVTANLPVQTPAPVALAAPVPVSALPAGVVAQPPIKV